MRKISRIAHMAIAVGAALALLPALAASQQPAPAGDRKTAITGWAGFRLGMSREDALRAMRPGYSEFSLYRYSDRIPTSAVSHYVDAPIGGHRYTANLTLEFWQDRLAVILILWDRATIGGFKSTDEFMLRASQLRQEILEAYSPKLVVRNEWVDWPPFMTGEGGGVLELRDADGNRLVMAATLKGRRDLWVAYLWGPYAREIDRTPPPKGNY